MNKEFLANAIGNIGDGYIEEFARVKKHRRLSKTFVGIGAVGIAAAVSLVIGLNVVKKPNYNDLPKILFEDYHGVAMGGIYGNKTILSKNSTPIWNESMKIETMPVYMSGSAEPDHEKMLSFVKNAAAALDIPEDELEISDNYGSLMQNIEDNQAIWQPSEKFPSFDPIRKMILQTLTVNGKAKDIRLMLCSNYQLWVTFGSSPEDGLELPSGYDFSEDAPVEERERALNYLAERFKELTGYENYTVNPERGYMISRADDGSDISKIVSGTLDFTTFEIVEHDGRYMLREISVQSPAGLEKLGDYPIISVDEAEKILRSVAYKDGKRLPEDAEILQTELAYENLTGYTAVFPYYNFYVRSDEPTDYEGDGIVCDKYSVPAIPSGFFEGADADS